MIRKRYERTWHAIPRVKTHGMPGEGNFVGPGSHRVFSWNPRACQSPLQAVGPHLGYSLGISEAISLALETTAAKEMLLGSREWGPKVML